MAQAIAKTEEVTDIQIPATGELKEVALSSIIVTDGWNPRSQFASEGLQELAADIAAHGFIQPPVVIAKPGGKFQLVAGERRYRAAKLLGLKTIPVNVKDVDSKGAFEQTISENLTRVNLHPIEEAEGFERLQRDHGMDIKEIAARTGKKPPYIINRLQLTSLCGKVKQTIFSLQVNLEIGYLFKLAQIRNDDLQMEVLKKILHRPHREGIMPLSDVDKLIEEYQVVISSAQFKTTDPNLYPKAGACTDCPYNTTNLPREAFAKKEICTNLGCFKEKQLRQFKIVCAASDGATIIPEKQAKNIFASYNPEHLSYGSGFVNIDKTYSDYSSSAKDKTWRTWFNKFDGEFMPRPHLVLNPFNHRIYTLAKEKEALEAIRKIKAKLNPNEGNQKQLKSEREIAEERRRKREQKAKTETLEWAINEISVQAVLDLNHVEGGALTRQSVDAFKKALLISIKSLKGYGLSDAYLATAKSRGIELTEAEKKKQKYEHGEFYYKHLLTLASEMSLMELMQLFVQLSIRVGCTYYNGYNTEYPKALTGASKEYGLDLNAKLKEVMETLKQAENEKGKKKKVPGVDVKEKAHA